MREMRFPAAQTDIDGGLIGGASLQSTFVQIVNRLASFPNQGFMSF